VVAQLLRDWFYQKGDKSLASGDAILAFSVVVSKAVLSQQGFCCDRTALPLWTHFLMKRETYSPSSSEIECAPKFCEPNQHTGFLEWH